MSHSEETRRKISQALMGHKHSPEALAKMRGRKRSNAFRERMRELATGRAAWNKGLKTGNLYPNSGQFQKGQKMSEVTKEKIRQAHLGRKRGQSEREKNRQSQYRRFEKEIPNYSYEDNGRRIRRKVRLKENGGFHSKSEWLALKAQHGNTCLHCKRKEPDIQLSKDHIISVFRGGTDDITNIQPLCRSCNSKKHSS